MSRAERADALSISRPDLNGRETKFNKNLSQVRSSAASYIIDDCDRFSMLQVWSLRDSPGSSSADSYNNCAIQVCCAEKVEPNGQPVGPIVEMRSSRTRAVEMSCCYGVMVPASLYASRPRYPVCPAVDAL